MMKTYLTLFLVCTSFAQAAPSSQGLPECSPYNWVAACNPPAFAVDFAEVLLGHAGSAYPFVAFVNLTNKEGTPNTFTIAITSELHTIPLQRTFVLRSFQRLPINLNDWPELAGFIGGVSVSVSAKGRGMAAVVMHSADGSPPIILSGR